MDPVCDGWHFLFLWLEPQPPTMSSVVPHAQQDANVDDDTDANADHHSFVLTFCSTLFLTPNCLHMKNDAWLTFIRLFCNTKNRWRFIKISHWRHHCFGSVKKRDYLKHEQKENNKLRVSRTTERKSKKVNKNSRNNIENETHNSSCTNCRRLKRFDLLSSKIECNGDVSVNNTWSI